MKKLLIGLLFTCFIATGFAYAQEHSITVWDDDADAMYLGNDGIISFLFFNFDEQWEQDGPHGLNGVGVVVADLDVHSSATGWFATMTNIPDGYNLAPGQPSIAWVAYPNTDYTFHIVLE